MYYQWEFPSASCCEVLCYVYKCKVVRLAVNHFLHRVCITVSVIVAAARIQESAQLEDATGNAYFTMSRSAENDH